MNPFRFLRDDRGSATMEFAIWFPMFVLLLLIAVDVSTFYMSQTRMQNVSRDAARRMSIGLIDGATLDTFVMGNLSGSGYSVTNCSDAVTSCVRIERSTEKSLVFGSWIDGFLGPTFVVQTTVPFEPQPA